MALGYGALARLRNLLAALVIGAGPVVAEPVVIAAVGDSLTAGYGLRAEDGFVPQMQAWLEAEGADVELINAGVSGDTTAGGLARIDWTLSAGIDGMILALGGNDLLRGIDPAVSRENLAGILDAAEAAEVEVLIVGLDATPNYGADFQTRFDAMFPELAEEYGALVQGSWFDGLRGAAEGDLVRARQYFQADGIHPSAEGVALIVDYMGPNVLALVERIEAGG